MRETSSRRILGLILLLMLPGTVARGEEAKAPAPSCVPVTIVNYSALPVYATAITLDAHALCGKLGVPAGTPLRVRCADGANTIPLSRGTDGERPVIRLYVALPPASRLDLIAERADAWQDATVAEARCEKKRFPEPKAGATPGGLQSAVVGELRNGVVRVALDEAGWDLGFDRPTTAGGAAEKAARDLLIENGRLDFWIDNQNRGRIMNADPKDLGLVHFATAARLEECSASVGPDGRPSLRVMWRLDSFAKDMTVTETFELVPGLPILLCRVRWRNEGDAPLWVAYVSSGDGIKGSWGKRLMAVPLIERKKSPLLGDLNGGETRCAWLGGICRVSMESPATGCGVGMSTLLPTPGKVGTGSMIWGCNGGGFQCNFIDPVQGQFPFLVKAHEALENGFAFLATQTGVSVFRQTVELWQALQAGKMPRLAPPCAVFLDGEPLCAQTVSAFGGAPGALDLLQPRGQTRQAALRLDFNKYFQCQVSVEADAPQDAVEVTARPLTPGKPAIPLLQTGKSGEHRIELNERFGKADEIAFVLEVKTSGAAALKGLSITEVLPVSPEPLAPLPDATFTDFATMFRWKALPLVVDYDLQLSQSADFAAPTEVRVSTSDPYPWYLPPENKLPAPGAWHWRIRGVKGEILGAWSQARSFTVNNDHATKPVKRPLTAQSPLFTLEASKVTDLRDFRPDIPADIAAYVGIIAEGYVGKGLTITEFMRGVDKLPHAIMIRSHHPTWVNLPDLEWVCQHVPNFIGIQGGETLSTLYAENKERDKVNGDSAYHRRMTMVCAKYGMLYQEADGTYKDDKWQDLMDKQGPFVREYGRYLVLTQKNNIIRRQFYSQSAAMGLWLGGITHQHGAWEDGGFYWQNAGFKELGQCAGERSGVLKTMPRIFWDLVFVMGISRGCGIYSVDGQTLMFNPKEAERWPNEQPRALIWSTSGETTDTFKRYVVPLIRGVVKHGLIPTKEQVLQNVKLAVYNDKKTPGDLKAWPHYVEYGPLYAGTYGFRKMGNIDGQLWEFFPNTGRYYYIPVLVQGNEPLGAGLRNVPLSELQDTAKVTETFNAAYPARHEGDALVCVIGDTITVQNTRENEDVTESYSVPLKRDWLVSLSGRVAPHSYLVGKIEDEGRRLWLQANTEYPERDTGLAIRCSRKPEWQIEPASAAKEASWDEAAKTLTLRLSHKDGAVEVELR